MARIDSMFADVVTAEAQLRAHIGHPSHRVLAKHVTALDVHSRAFIARSPLVMIASPKGDPPGFVHVLDDRTLAIPERPGNRKADTFSNLIENRRVGLLFMIPGKQETLRVSGSAAIVRDQWLRDRLAAHGKTPELALAVTVEEVFFHCAKCVIRSQLWNPGGWPDLSGLPTLAQAMVDAGGLAETPAQMQALIDQDIRQRLY
jgi:PPOX class probable FMN-dependent enzyme